MSRSECEMSPTALYFKHDLQLVVLFWEAVKPLRYGTLLEAVAHWGADSEN